MSLSRYQLERTDLTVIIEQGRRVEGDLYAENHRSMQTMGELLKARHFGSTEWAISLRKRMTKFQGGGGSLANSDSAGPRDRPPELYDGPRTGIPLRADQTAGDRKQEHGVAGDREAGPLARPTTVQGGGTALPVARAPEASHRPPEPDPHPEHGVLCDCPDCDEAVKRLLRDCGILPKGQPDRLDLVTDPLAWFKLKAPLRHRRDESDR